MRRLKRKAIRSVLTLSIFFLVILALEWRLTVAAFKSVSIRPVTLQSTDSWPSPSRAKLSPSLASPASPTSVVPLPSNPYRLASPAAWPKNQNRVYFIPNQGQFSPPVEFALQDKDKAIFFSAGEVTILLASETSPWAVKMRFLGCPMPISPVPEGTLEATFSYFKGSEKEWKTGVPAYSQIRYPNLWPGVDLVYSSSPDGLKSQFIIRPGADPANIRLALEGASCVTVNEQGELVMVTPAGKIIEKALIAYQMINGRRVNVEVAYRIISQFDDSSPNEDSKLSLKNSSREKAPGFIYGFSLAPYDPAHELILDPVVMVAGSYIGGPSFDYGYGVALDSAGFVYITGYTYSVSGFPLVAGPQLSFRGGDVDAYVAKIDPTTSRLVYCGFIGGLDKDFAYDIAVDETGSAYVVGYTGSSEKSFPVVKGPDLSANGRLDVFIAKVNPAGTGLDYCGFIGGANDDYGQGVAVDAEGRAYITGYTLSNAATFPVKIGPSLVGLGKHDAFVARVSASGEELEYCGFIGGLEDEYAYGIAVDSKGAAYIAGSTDSTETFFPVVTGPDLSSNGGFDAFVAKVSPSGESLLYCGFIGGKGEDVATAIAVDSSGYAYVTGYTASDENSFPLAFGPDVTYNGGFYDGFVAKVWVDGSLLAYSGFIGGVGYDIGTGVAIDQWGCAYVTGFTSSNPDSFPAKEGPDLTLHGSFDAFLAKVARGGTKLDFCGYLGGSGADFGEDVVVEKEDSGVIYLTGSTYSADIESFSSLLPSSPFQGKRDAFLVRYEESSITVISPNGFEVWYSGFKQDITWWSVGDVGPVRIEFSSDDGTTWEAVAAETENDGRFTWVVPDVNSTTCYIRISEAEDGIPSDTSDRSFYISNIPVIVVTSPNGGEEWPVGTTQEVTWLTGSAPVGDVRIEYTIDGGLNWAEIIDRTENDGVYEWEIPDTPSTECLVRISEAEDGDPIDRSDAFFSIVKTDSGSTHSHRIKNQEEGGKLLRPQEVKKPGKKNSAAGGSP